MDKDQGMALEVQSKLSNDERDSSSSDSTQILFEQSNNLVMLQADFIQKLKEEVKGKSPHL